MRRWCTIWRWKFFDENGKVIYELNKGTGKIKEYDYCKGFLLYEGEYLNGRRNGKGKEYNAWNGKLKFEGELLKGKRNGKGKGKEYGYDALKPEFIFEGEYLNGERKNARTNKIIRI